ncbi:hypothetical protein [Thiofilum flexile]|uniref:alpha/beta hydrolase n=1 Tax=Thiofilum flexile TaxID=125627 RepID=UPI00035CAA9D|nr:hypothetical protein [Thiofilum flexile]
MNRHAFHRLALVSYLVLIGLTGCGGADNGDQVGNGTTVEYSATARMLYDPANSVIPTTNDLLFSGSTDGTLNLPISSTDSSAALKTMLNTLDGFSLTMPFTTTLNEAPLASSVVLGQSVRVFEVTKSSGLVASVTRELTSSELLATLDSTGTTLALVPLKPLKESTSYLVVVTNALKDSVGKAVSTSSSYAVLKGSAVFTDSTKEALRLQINAHETAAASAGVSKDSIILSWSFTTQSVTPVLSAVKTQATARALQTRVTPVTSTYGQAQLHMGTLQVPYYLSRSAPLTAYWHGASSSYLTRYNTAPVATSTQTIPVMLTIPTAASGKTMPASGWPVVIYQHGITSNRATVLAIADTLASQGFAAIAIDLPLHGINVDDEKFAALRTSIERTFDLDVVNNTTGATGADGVIDESGKHFINLAVPLVSRDNIRQAISDILVLRNSLSSLQSDTGVVLDTTKVSFTGISLGSMVGVGYLATETTSTPALLSVPGGGIARLLDGSATFGPAIRAGLASSGVIAGTAAYDSFMFATQFMLDSADPINLAATAVSQHPVLLHEVVGSTTSASDQVVPNSVTGYPLSGTEPLIRMMGLSSASTSKSGSDAAVRFTAGGHSSLLSPTASSATTTEMQRQMAAFLATQGTQIVITDTSVVK